jgi:nitrate/nitrite transport system permease protein
MSSLDPAALPEDDPVRKAANRARLQGLIARLDPWFALLGLAWVGALWRMLIGESPKPQMTVIWRTLLVPVLSIGLFLSLWAWAAPKVETSLGAIPGPAQVWDQVGVLRQDAVVEHAKEVAFYEKQTAKNAELIAAGKTEEVKNRSYAGKPTFADQIFTSLQTVFMGFLLATLVAVPLGIMAGLSPTANAALSPLVQLFKPVSPLAWLPIVTMVISALYAGGEGGMSKSFLISAVTVTLCSLWPTLINTALGVATIDKDLVNVGRVLKLGLWTRITKLVLPSALPLIFTGLRLSLGVGWMVLIAAEMLAQNPGLGKFVWDEFQNGSSDSLARIMVAVLTIGIIGLLLDRVMVAFQTVLTFQGRR